jgi:hypothetical protein
MRKVAVIGIDRVTEVSRTSVVGAIGVDVVVHQFWVLGVEELEIVRQVGQQIDVQTGFSP